MRLILIVTLVAALTTLVAAVIGMWPATHESLVKWFALLPARVDANFQIASSIPPLHWRQ